MARRRIMEYGPSVRGGRHTSLETVSTQRIQNSRGVFLRESPGLSQQNTAKSRLVPKEVRGIKPPGFQPINYPSPNF